MRLGCFIPLLTIALIIGGGQGVYTAATNREPKVYTIDEYLAKRPSEKWVRITGGLPDFSGATYQSFLGQGPVREVNVPLRATKEPADGKVHVLVTTKDPAMLEAIEKTRKMQVVDALKYVVEHHKELMTRRDVQGLVRFGIESSGKRSASCAKRMATSRTTA